MAKHTKKVGTVDKYASLRKMVKKTEVSQHVKYIWSFCGKSKTKSKAIRIPLATTALAIL
uniref:Uncharacterized protein n=1 Tax=Salvator merianae TaxID=96440 RepID=A0A8D0BBG9_SALMN